MSLDVRHLVPGAWCALLTLQQAVSRPLSHSPQVYRPCAVYSVVSTDTSKPTFEINAQAQRVQPKYNFYFGAAGGAPSQQGVKSRPLRSCNFNLPVARTMRLHQCSKSIYLITYRINVCDYTLFQLESSISVHVLNEN